MKRVNEAYTAAMAKQFRNQSVVTVTLKNYNRGMVEDGSTWVSNGEEAYSDVTFIDYSNPLGDSLATLELNYWMLDGSVEIYNASAYEDQGYVSSEMSDEDGVFATPPVITREFTFPHTSTGGIAVWFNKRQNTYPRSFEISFYLEGSPVQTIGSVGTYDVEYVYTDLTPITFDKIEIKILDTYPYYRVRIEDLFVGLYLKYSNDKIININQINDVDPLSRRLPEQKASVTILDMDHLYDPDNPTGVYSLINEKTTMTISYGLTLDTDTTYTLSPDWYIMTGNPSVANGRVTFNGTKQLGWMTGRFFRRKYETKVLENLARDILNDADIPPVRLDREPFLLDSSLSDLNTRGVPEIDTHAAWLQMLAHAACCKLYCNSENVIIIEKFKVSALRNSGFVLDFDSIFHQSMVFSKSPELQSVQVAKYSYTKKASTVVFEDDLDDDGVYGEYQLSCDHTVTMSGEDVGADGAYARAIYAARLVGADDVSVTGKPLDEHVTIYTETISSAGEIDFEQNRFVTNKTLQKALASHAAGYLSLRDTYDFDYRGNPELEPGDVIRIQTAYSESLKVLILRTELNYSGALSGHLKVKVLA